MCVRFGSSITTVRGYGRLRISDSPLGSYFSQLAALRIGVGARSDSDFHRIFGIAASLGKNSRILVLFLLRSLIRLGIQSLLDTLIRKL